MLIRADASPEIGTGHVMRCLALAQSWQDAGGSVIFAMAQSTPSIRARLVAENCKIVSIAAIPGSNQDADLTDEYAAGSDVEWMVVDGYVFGGEYQERLQNGERKLLCIDDAGKCDHYFADIVLNQNLTAAKELYRNCLPATQLLLGPCFCLLRREFAPWRKWQRETVSHGRNVLITLGGSTSVEAGRRVMESLSHVSVESLHAIFVVGGSSHDVAALESHAAKFSSMISIRRDVLNMAELMAEAAVAISAAGSTCWELCLLGLPSILLDVADNQIPIAIEMERRGCAIYAGHGNTVSPHELAHRIEKLLAAPDIRESMAHRCRQLVDGLGAERVVSAMRDHACASPVYDARGARA